MKSVSSKGKKIGMIIAFAVLILVISVGITLSYLMSRTETIENKFVPSKVACSVVETFEDGIKRNVSVKNTGNIDAYMRAMVVVNWVDEEGRVLANAPVENTNYEITWTSDGWLEGSDGFWYYRSAVAPHQKTGELIESAKMIGTAPNGYSLSIEIIASAIQSEPDDAVLEAWNVTVNTNGTINPN